MTDLVGKRVLITTIGAHRESFGTVMAPYNDGWGRPAWWVKFPWQPDWEWFLEYQLEPVEETDASNPVA